jgi:hypothetical protein
MPCCMAATGFSQQFLNKARTSTVEAKRARAFIGKHVARVSLCGPTERKGLGISDPRARDASTKVSTLFRLLNTSNATPAVSALAAGSSSWEALHAKTKHQAAHIPALHKGAARGLSTRPKGLQAMHIIRASVNLSTALMGDLVPPCQPYGLATALHGQHLRPWKRGLHLRRQWLVRQTSSDM